MVTSKLWAAPSGQHKPPWGPVFQLWALLGVLGFPLLMEPGVVIKAKALSRWTPGLEGACTQQGGGQPMATGVMGEPMGNQTHISKANQMQTQTKTRQSSSSKLFV